MNTKTRRIITACCSAAIAMPIGIAGAAAANAATLPSEAARTLQYMVAEEKLAHDVYTALGEEFGIRAFDRMASAEERHQSSVRTLLDRYGIADPTVGDAVGEFDDPGLQRLYDQVVADGRSSPKAAARAGQAVERRDITDLDEAIAANPPADITQVLERLRSGSTRHLAAFTRLAATARG